MFLYPILASRANPPQGLAIWRPTAHLKPYWTGYWIYQTLWGLIDRLLGDVYMIAGYDRQTQTGQTWQKRE